MGAKERLQTASDKLFLTLLDGAMYQAVKIYEKYNPDKVRLMSYGGKTFKFSDSGCDLRLEDQFKWVDKLAKGGGDPELNRLFEAEELKGLRFTVELLEFVFNKK